MYPDHAPPLKMRVFFLPFGQCSCTLLNFSSMEEETVYLKSEIKEVITAIDREIYQIENLHYSLITQRPLFVPRIKQIEHQIKVLEINKKTFIDRLNKLDGCFQ